MNSAIVVWEDSEKSKIARIPVDAAPIAYRTAPYTYWKLIIADEDLEIRKNETAVVKIRKIQLPGNTIVSPLSVMGNRYGIVMDVYESYPPRIKIELPKEIEYAAFLPVQDGEIRKGDMLGVVKVFVVGVGRAEDMTKLKASDAIVNLEEVEVNLVCDERRAVKVKEYRYKRRHIAEWLPVVADEDFDVEAGKVAEILIRKLKLPPQTIPVPLSIMRHPMGTLLDLGCDRIRRVEEGMTADRAIFMPVRNGEVKKGDLIGVINNYYISIGDMPSAEPVLGSYNVNLVYLKNGEIVRKSFELQPFGFKRSEIGMLVPVVAAENVEFRRGEVKVFGIDAINLPAGTIVQPLHERNHPLGTMIDVVEEKPTLVEEDKRIVGAVFYAIGNGEIRRGDIVGVLNVYNVAVLSPAR